MVGAGMEYCGQGDQVSSADLQSDCPLHEAVRPVDTEKTETELELFKTQQLANHFGRVGNVAEISGALAHELQQPLTSILCNAQAAQHLLAQDPPNLALLRDALVDIISEDKRAGQLIQHLRSLLTRDRIQLRLLNLADVISNAVAITRHTLAQRRVQVTTHVEERIAPVQGARVELEQVLLNLILNASEAMAAVAPGERRIVIVAGRGARRDTVRISVLDHGPGIETSDLERIFDPYVSTKEGGMGLGLAICRSIVAAHRGRLWAANRSGGGAAFHLTLPVAHDGHA